MRKTFSFVLSTCFVAGMAMAAPQSQDQSAPSQQEQPAGHRRANPERRVKMLAKRLNLTAEQQQQLLPILTDRQQQMDAIFHDNSLSKEDRMAKMRSLREDSESKIKAVLTDEQKQTYEQMRQQSRERSHDRRNSQNRRRRRQQQRSITAPQRAATSRLRDRRSMQSANVVADMCSTYVLKQRSAHLPLCIPYEPATG